MILWPNELEPENAVQVSPDVVVLLADALLAPLLDVAPTACIGCVDWPDEPPQPASNSDATKSVPKPFLVSRRLLFHCIINWHGVIVQNLASYSRLEKLVGRCFAHHRHSCQLLTAYSQRHCVIALRHKLHTEFALSAFAGQEAAGHLGSLRYSKIPMTGN